MFLKLCCDINSDPCKVAVWRILGTTIWHNFKGSGKKSTWKKKWAFEGKISYGCKTWSFIMETLSLNSKQRVAKEWANAFWTGSLRKQILEDNRVMRETEHLSKIASSIQVLQLIIQPVTRRIFQAESSQ